MHRQRMNSPIDIEALKKAHTSAIPKRMAKPRTLPRHFARDLVLVFALLSAVVIGAVAYYAAQARHDISQKYIDDAAMRAAEEFHSMTAAMSRDLQRVRDWGSAGKLSLAQPEGLNGLLFPLLKAQRLLLGISVADTDGESFYVANDGDGWRTSRTGASEVGRRTVRRHWDAEQRLMDEQSKASTYDPRRRPWFFPAISTRGIFWTSTYTFYDRKDVGITAAAACVETDGKPQLVVAFDVLLGDLFAAIQRMAPSANSRVLIFRQNAQLYTAQSGETPPDFTPVTQVKDPLVKAAFAAWEQGSRQAAHTFSVRHGDETWWSGFKPLETDNRSVWIGVMVPETDILGGISRRQTLLWWMAALVVGVSGALSFWLIRRHGRPAGLPSHRFDPVQPGKSIRRLIAMGEGRTVEFKATMRMNLHTQKPGKEIETAWLKAVCAFMNTDGGILLIGVDDAGEIAGLEQDGFDSQDKCKLHFKNLIAQHIGAELSQYLRFNIVTVENRQVGVVSCDRSPDPAFLKSGKNETFYIRNGPSSDALPVSKVVAYIQSRKQHRAHP